MKKLSKRLMLNAIYYSAVNYWDNYEHESKYINWYVDSLDNVVKGIVDAIFRGEVEDNNYGVLYYGQHQFRFVGRDKAEKQVKEFLINHIKNERKDLLKLKNKIKAIGEIYDYK